MCTRVFNFKHNCYAITAKNTDWFYPMDTRVYINPEGVTKRGMSDSLMNHYNECPLLKDKIETEDILSWRSKYQSICYYIYGKLPKRIGYFDIEFCAMDGMNSAGLAVSVLADSKSSFKMVQQPGTNKIATIRFSQYLLDSFATVTEAVKHIKDHPPFLFDPGVPNKSDRDAWFHFALSDPSGDSAIIEFNKGKADIYHNSDYVIVTNQPSYDVQLNILQYWQYQWQPNLKGGEKDGAILTTVPGGTSSVQRFERASYYLNFIQPLTCPKQAVSQTKGIMSTVTTPMNFSKEGEIKERYSYTIWTTLCDQMNRRYYFQPSQTMNSMYLDLLAQHISFSGYVQVAKEEENDYWLNDSAGDISAQLKKTAYPPFVQVPDNGLATKIS